MPALHSALNGLLPASSRPLLGVHLAALLIMALVAGATFGIWRGYDPRALSDGAFLEMHKGAVAGLNTLLPVLGALSIVLTLVLALRSGGTSGPLWPFLLALGCMVGAGLVTRLGNQPINAKVIGWTPDTFPADWQALRARWWHWHEVRTALSSAGFLALATGILTSRG